MHKEQMLYVAYHVAKAKGLHMRIQVPELATPTTKIVRSCTTRADLVHSPCLCTLYLADTNTMARPWV